MRRREREGIEGEEMRWGINGGERGRCVWG